MPVVPQRPGDPVAPIKMPHASAAYPWTVNAYERSDGLRVQARLPRTLSREEGQALLQAIQTAVVAFLDAGPSPEPSDATNVAPDASQTPSPHSAEG